MTWVITRLCRDCVDKSCIDVCPVECIYEYKGDDREAFPNQLYIQPEECIDCGACEPECPVTAIFAEEDTPAEWTSYIEKNKVYFETGEERVVAQGRG
jgi:NAD-dependent dihydropyrimidine dehydrogenase PreA subunit